MSTKSKAKEIVVAGDVALDWNLVNLGDKSAALGWIDILPSQICWNFGGSLLLTDLIAEISKSSSELWRLHRVTIPRATITTENESFVTSYASWSVFPRTAAPEDAKKPKTWRVKDFLGVTQAPHRISHPLDSDSGSPDIIVLDDANLGFRSDRSQWPQALTARDPNSPQPWVVIKMARPLAQGELWDELYKNWADRLIVVLSVKDLRLSEVQISSELSWERTAQDVAWELVYNPKVNAIARCAHAIVSFNAAGAIWLDKTETQASLDIPRCTLFFDPQVIEGAWEQNYPGKIMGYNTCLTASLVSELMAHPDAPDLSKAVKAGLVALRKLHGDGYEYLSAGASRPQLAFPFQAITQEMTSEKEGPFAEVEIQFPTRLLDPEPFPSEHKPVLPGIWTILQQSSLGDLDALAARILSDGAEAALVNVPLGKFGNLLTVDRREIESFRGIRRLVNEYCSQEKTKRPLNIAVFGPPGSGKSFGITQVAKALRPGEIEDITFNLSQFGSVDELFAAFHQVRDLNLAGKTPLVFWDEFDSVFDKQKFGWLRYFLAPMQDGKFMEHQLLHPIGKAIFVFAGGICHSIENFVSESETYRDAKAPDFISRLRGYVNIMGANPPEPGKDEAVSDPFYLVRRAILLRSILWMNVPHIFENRSPNGKLKIDNTVMRALLNTRLYKHGARSMEAVIGMSNLAGKNHFDQSSLPSEAQLDLHVDGQDFLAWVHQIVLEGQTLERLAAINHEIYCERMKAKGFTYGPVREDALKTRPLLIPYAEIPEYYQESNRNAVRSIAEKLAAIGYIMIQARSNEPPFNFPGQDLERLAEMEHQRYLQDAVSTGWHYGAHYDESSKTNPTLLPWRALTAEETVQYYPNLADKIGCAELSEAEKQKDCDQILGYTEILRRAGYAIVKLRRSSL
jgi:hypothetical protein